jgi:hypothetical protein
MFYPIRPPKMSATSAALGTVASVSGTAITSSGLAVFPVGCEIIRSGSPYRTITPAAYFTSAPAGIDQDSNL